MKRPIPGLLWLLAASVVLSQSARSDLVWITGNPEPIPGIVLRQTGESLEFQAFRENQFQQPETLPMSDVVRVLQSLDVQRLTDLSLANPAAYFEYAEELAVATHDPAALQTARRLYAISATHAVIEIRISSLLGLRRLESQSERKRSISRYLAVTLGERQFLNDASQAPTAKREMSDLDKQTMLGFVRAIRQGDSRRATELSGQLSDRSILDQWQEDISGDQLLQFANGQEVSREALLTLLTIEMQLVTGAEEPAIARNSRERDWAYWSVQPATPQALIPTMGTLTGFDPRQTRYRAGQWIEPPTAAKPPVP